MQHNDAMVAQSSQFNYDTLHEQSPQYDAPLVSSPDLYGPGPFLSEDQAQGVATASTSQQMETLIEVFISNKFTFPLNIRHTLYGDVFCLCLIYPMVDLGWYITELCFIERLGRLLLTAALPTWPHLTPLIPQ